VPALQRVMIVREARVLWLCCAVVLTLSLVLRRADALIYWIIPAMLGQPFLRLYLFSEHAGCAMNDDTFANTRTTYTNAAIRFLAWQMPFHVEHHAFPAVPFHALKLVNAKIRDRIEVQACGYFATHRGFIRRMRRDAATPAPDLR
jgi:fatty acid desaturase